MGKKGKQVSMNVKIADSVPSSGWKMFPHFKVDLINKVDTKNSIAKDGQKEYSEGTRSSTTQTELEHQSHEDFGSVIAPSEDMQSPKQTYYEPIAPTFYPPIYDDGPKVEPLIHLSEVLDINSLGPEEVVFFPLLEEVCLRHPSLIESLTTKSPKYILWSFTALGQVLHFLKTMKVKNMNKEACKHLECLWEEAQLFGFNLTWLEPYIESALNVEAYLEKGEKVKNLKEHVVDLEIELRMLRTKLAVAEVILDIARRDLEEVEKDFEERDINAEMGYGK
ncbi:hypothetical protein TanjilG_10726 [Lupinus angustifolius]|uniref:MATH domain-containing protein n=1 Tax=Lupinus angustifolius TaxID=3871 RepID=A0A1J7HF11_LUPAN|nr:hypothetical protein TanjilG_10724 [Lupinus angustifolius]OIW11408.1 hypothetical protein TanjilG_10726 [Lupinus angustifolius]